MNAPSDTSSSRAGLLLVVLSLAGCNAFEVSTGEKVDYRGSATKTASLEVPPDLTQLAREGRYQPQGGVISANNLRQSGTAAATAASAAPSAVAPNALGGMRIERQGNSRWLVAAVPPEQLFPQVRAFWLERGFALTIDDPKIGLMETEWAENRAKLPQDFIRRTVGRVLDGAYSTSERDRFRTRIERTDAGSEIFISHRGLIESFTDGRRDQTVWQARPTDPELEAEFLSRLMVKLGAKEEAAQTAVAAASVPGLAKARVATLPTTAAMELDEGFDRAWRQVGLALDRTGFTVEDRDRGAGLYFVRYIDPKLAGKEEPNFFAKLFSGDKEVRPQRLRVVVKSTGSKTQVSVQNSEGAADNSDAARSVIGKLIDELK